MPHPAIQLLRAGLLGLLALPAARAEEMPLKEIETSEGQWVFQILPNAFQKNPQVDQTVITEMTAEGRKLPLPTRENPAYYVVYAGGLHREGHGPVDSRPPTATDLERSLQHALSINHYLPADPGHPPALVIFYHWGLHSNLDQGSLEVEGSGFPDRGHRNLLSRAALVGGAKFAGELKVVLQKQDDEDEVRSGLPGDIAGTLFTFGPLWQFTHRDYRTQHLYDESLSDCYYVIASAYNYQAVARGERRLLWRSKMTVDAQGVAMRDTLPNLILNAGKYLGRDMPVPATLTKRVPRDGTVKLGPLEVKEYLDKPGPATAEKSRETPPEPKAKP